ncbi:MAG: FliH/SctL family protein [Desulfobacteraceae bacterium]
MSSHLKDDYSPLYNVESFQADETPPEGSQAPSGSIAKTDDSVRSWNFPAIEREDPTTEEDFKTKIARLEREAYEKGFAQGQKDGLDLEKSKMAEMGKQYEALMAELRDLKVQIFRDSEGEMLSLVELIVKKVIGEEIKTGEAVIRHSIRSAAKFLTDKRKVRIIINPEDMEEVKKMLPDLARLTKGGNFQLTEDPTVGKGGCMLETGFGRVNATIDDQLDEIIKVIDKEYLMITRGML